MTYDNFDCEIRDGTAHVHLIGPGPSSMSELSDELVDLMLRLQEDAAVRVILLVDGDNSFHIAENRNSLSEQRCQGQSFESLAPELDIVQKIVILVQDSSKPVVAATRGAVTGGGLGFYLVADVRLACSTATFTAPDLSCGLFPIWGLSFTLPRLIGPGRTLEFLWSRRTIGAAEAGHLGLVDRVIEDEVWDTELAAFVDRLARTPQPVVHLAKLATQQASQLDLTSMLSYEFEAQQKCWSSQETAAGMAAYLSSSDPEFVTPASPDDS